MKTRNGFVSNSSSSSFIVALQEEPKLTIGDTSIPISKLVSTRVLNASGSVDDFVDEMNGEFCCIEPENGESLLDAVAVDIPWIKDAVELHNKGYKIIRFDIDYSDETGSSLVNLIIKHSKGVELSSY
ncbi:MAG: hypothetical protein ACRCWQ_02150 [Bacilli bacterium]